MSRTPKPKTAPAGRERNKRAPDRETLIAEARRLGGLSQWQQAAAIWNDVRQLDPQMPLPYEEGARCLAQAGAFAQADTLLIEGQSRFPDQFGLYFWYAWIAEHQQNWAEALERWSLLAARHPGSWMSYAGPARCLRHLSRFEDSERILRTGLDAIASEPHLYIDYAISAAAQRNWPQARERWQTVIDRFPAIPSGYTGAANVCQEAGDVDAAETFLRQGLELFPGNPDFAVQLARLAKAQSNFSQAATLWESVRNRFPAIEEAYLAGSAAHLQNGEPGIAAAILDDASVFFPESLAVHADRAKIAEHMGQWDVAEGLWRNVIRRDPGLGWPRRHLASALFRQGRGSDAESALLEAKNALPEDREILIAYARAAESRRDWDAARERWATLKARLPALLEGYRGEATALIEMGLLDAARQVLETADTIFPDNPDICHDLGRLAQRRQDWIGAEQYWRACLARQPGQYPVHAALALALQEQNRTAEAITILEAAIQQFPELARPLHDRARLADRLGEWADAERFWQRAITLQDKDWWAYTALAWAIARQGDRPRAEAILTARFGDFPDVSDLYQTYATLAEQDRQWPEARRRWQLVRERFPSLAMPIAAESRTARLAGDIEAAEAILAAARTSHPAEIVVWQESAALAEQQRDWPRAESYWRQFLSIRSNLHFAFVHLAKSLMEMGRLDEAGETLEHANQQFPGNIDVWNQRALLAESRQQWHEALTLWNQIEQNFPGRIATAARIYVVRMKILDHEIELVAAPGGDLSQLRLDAAEGQKPNDSDYNLMMAFESLSGITTGCEFGAVQRAFGAEPLGLLRWAGVTIPLLTQLLERNFHRIGDPETTEIKYFEGAYPREYGIQDKTFEFGMHAHIYENQQDAATFYKQACRRLQFLRRKLIDDLANPDKIFLVKDTLRIPTEAEIDRLYAAKCQYGNNLFLVVVSADDGNPPNTVRHIRPGLWLGYMDFSGAYDTARVNRWRALCAAAYREIRA